MSTKTIVLGEEKTPLKKIEFKMAISFPAAITGQINVHPANNTPSSYYHIELVRRGSTKPGFNCFYDIMFAYNTNREIGVFYMGYWNDGVA